MKKLKFVVILVFSFTTLFSQTRQNYKGSYKLKLPYVQDAVANYTYYNKDDSKILDGNFNLEFKGKGGYLGFNIIVTGKYFKNKKNGNWKHEIKLNNWQYPNRNKYYTGYKKLNANYTNGMLNGLVSYSSSEKWRKKDFYGNFLSFTAINSMDFRLQFKNGIAVNKFYSKKHNGETQNETIIEAEMDDNGFLKSWKEVVNGVEELKIYEDGILKDDNFLTTKKQIEKYKYFKNNYPDSLNYIDFRIDTISNIINDILTEGFNWGLLFNDLEGDDFYNETKFDIYSGKQLGKTKLNYFGACYLETYNIIPKNYEKLLDSCKQTNDKLISKLNKNLSSLYNTLYSIPPSLKEIKKELRNLNYELTDLGYDIKNIMNFYSSDKKEHINNINKIDSVYKKLQQFEKDYDKIEKNRKIITYNLIIKEAETKKDNGEYKESLKKVQEAEEYAKNNKDAILNNNKTKQLRNEINKLQQFLKNKNSIYLTEIILKAPPQNMDGVSSGEQSKIKKYYNLYQYFDNTQTYKEIINLNFPKDKIIITKLFFYYDDSRYYSEAKNWRKNSEYIYKAFQILTEGYRVRINNTSDDKQLKIAEELQLYLSRFNKFIINEKRKDYNKLFKKAEDLDSVLKILNNI